MSFILCCPVFHWGQNIAKSGEVQKQDKKGFEHIGGGLAIVTYRADLLHTMVHLLLYDHKCSSFRKLAQN